MSSEAFAALRKHAGTEYAALAEEHFKHDLQETDRQTLLSAARSFGTWTTAGSIAGLTLSLLAAIRLRRLRARTFAAFRATEKPTHVRFADGREEAIPDITPLMKPSIWGDVLTYGLFAAGGVFLGGELGMVGGAFSARRKVEGDVGGKERIEKAFRGFRVDLLRREADLLEKGQGGLGGPGGRGMGRVVGL